jgi:hypothetical protein
MQANGGVPVQAALINVDWTSLVVGVAGLIFGNRAEDAIRAAVAEIKAAIAQSQAEIIAHVDAVAAAQVQACVRAAAIEFQNIDLLSPPVLALWAQQVTGCATLATAYVNTLQSRPSIDNVGVLIGPIFAIVLAARARAGLIQGTELVLQDQIRAYEAVVAKLVPVCSHRWEKDDNPRHIYPVHITCEAYPGKVGRDTRFLGWIPGNPEPSVPYSRAMERCDAQTSRGEAIAALPRLRAILPVM